MVALYKKSYIYDFGILGAVSYFDTPKAYKGIPSPVPNPSIRKLVRAIGYVDW